MGGTHRPAKKAKLTFTCDFELQSQATVHHISTTSSESVLTSDCLIVPATPDKPARPNCSHLSPISGPDFGQDIPGDNDDLGTVHYLPGPTSRKCYSNMDEPLKQWKPLPDELFIGVTSASTEVYCVRIVALIIIAASLYIKSSLQSKLSAHQFYCVLERGTNNTGLLNLQANNANFHLKNHSNTVIDVDLRTGWFKVPRPSGLAAIDHTNTKNSKGLCITGVGASICTCHGFLHPLGIGDLQKGERFSNMDYIIFSALRGYSPPSLVLSYDLICQYWTKIRQRMPRLPPELWVDLDKLSVKLFLPKLHMLAHKSECSVLYSLNFTPGVGCMDGEGIEREWVEINIAANSTKEMSEGAHHDMLDDLLGDKNFQKEIGLGKSLLTKLKTAQVESAKHVEQFKSFTGGLDLAMIVPSQIPTTLGLHDLTILLRSAKTQADIQLELLESEQSHLSLTGGHAIHNTSATSFLCVGLEIEEAQRWLARDVTVYMPETALLITVDIITDTPLSLESSLLFLPHALNPELQISPLAKSLAEMIAKLHFAQALDSLAEVRHSLCVLSPDWYQICDTFWYLKNQPKWGPNWAHIPQCGAMGPNVAPK
ncbi:hypothetical protein BS47DRAFT_1368135 [Hydnum rufescens UP504]|uniref:Uncharacterized protein n=1 Tax=Hydnum rufescens UP504 TaxID=1448309 RepID=A0A9P6AGH0_9AGAM|nr:hypothetical protein BS47DRAFT_1368135 [Hydnum rufescens UP504]